MSPRGWTPSEPARGSNVYVRGESEPPFDGWACPACPGVVRALYAVATNLLSRLGEHGGVVDATTAFELRSAVAALHPIVLGHFADHSHSAAPPAPPPATHGGGLVTDDATRNTDLASPEALVAALALGGKDALRAAVVEGAATDRVPTAQGEAQTLGGTPVSTHRLPQPDGTQLDYLVLTDEERARGFVRPVRASYKHVGKRPSFPLRELTDEERATHGDSFVAFETYPAESAPRVGRFWTRAELDSGCGGVTSMGLALAETYAARPTFYGATFCVGCRGHHPVGAEGEFVWVDDRGRVVVDADGMPVRVGT